MTQSNDHRANPQRIRGLDTLLDTEFSSGRGMLRTSDQLGVQVRAQSGSAPGLIDLEVRLFPPHPAAPQGNEESLLLETVEDLGAQLREGPRRLRAAACQALGHLDHPEAIKVLQEYAVSEDDSYLRGLAEDGLRRLQAKSIGENDLTLIDLWLIYFDRDSRERIVRATTDECGLAVFEAIPGQAECRLSARPPGGWDENRALLDDLGRALADLSIEADAPIQIGSRYWRGEAVLSSTGEGTEWSARIRLEPRLAGWPATRLWRVCAVRENRIWEAGSIGGRPGEYVVRGLARARYGLCLRQPTRAVRQVSGAFATAAGSLASSEELGDPQILHLADWPVVAMFERDAMDRVLVTVSSTEFEIVRHGLRCTLEEEELDILLRPAGSHWWQGHARSAQDYRGDEALRAKLVPLAKQGV